MSYWLILLFMLLASAFFSGMEIAFVSANKLVIELDKKRGAIAGKILSFFSKNQANFIAAMLVGNNIALVVYGIVMAKILEPFLIEHLPEVLSGKMVILIIQTLLSTLLILFTAEYMPKSLFRINPNNTIKIFAVPALFFYVTLSPIVLIVMEISKFFGKYVFKMNLSNEAPAFRSIDLYHYLHESKPENTEENEVEQEVQMFQRAIDMNKVKLRECMVPRTEIEVIEQGENIQTLKEKFVETGLSKILIYSESIDNIIGYVHSFDFFKNPKTIKEIERPILIVPETMPSNKLLNTFIAQKKNIAVVVDEFGGTSGIATLEDLVEEIFGEIRDEYDVDELIEIKDKQGRYILSARHKIDYLNEKYNLTLPESEDYETIGGLIIHYQESIPKLHDRIVIEGFSFKILEATRTKIQKVLLSINSDGDTN